METPQVIVAVLVMNGSTLLLGQDVNTGKWTLPKGGVLKYQPLQAVGETATLETTGVAVTVTGSIFVSEEMNTDTQEHNIIVITLAKPTSPENTALSPHDVFTEVRWVDVRDLGGYQETVDNLTADAIMKFGYYLQSKARGARG